MKWDYLRLSKVIFSLAVLALIFLLGCFPTASQPPIITNPEPNNSNHPPVIEELIYTPV